MRRWLLPLVLLAAPALAEEREVLVPDGKSVRCINQRQLMNTDVIDKQTIDFQVGRRIYRNTLQWACPNLDLEMSFRQFNATAGLCEGDLITSFNRIRQPNATGTCPLGRFQPMKAVKAPPED
jgi:hypothetical protein